MKQKHTFSVDAALDSIDLKFTDYTPSTDALEFFNLIRIFMGEDFEVPNPKFHYFIVDLLFGNIKREDFPYSPEIRNEIKLATSRIGILSARGSAKSTITTLFYPIYAAIKGSTPATGKLSHILILSDSQQGGSRDQSLLMGNMLNRSKFAKEWFEKIRFTESEVEVIRKGNTPVEQRHMLIKFKGANAGGIRSGSRNPVTGDRYALMIADDVIKSEADSKSEIIMRNVTTALTSDALNAMRAKKTQFIVINTPFSKKDPIYSMIESGGFTPLVTPICKEMTSNLKREDFIGLWEDMHNYDSLMERWDSAMATGSTREFNQELMLRISSEEDKLMKDEHIQEYSRKSLMRNLDYYNLYMTTDLTASNSAKGDFSCVMLWAVGSNNDIFLLDLHVKKCTIAEQYEPIFDMVRTWGTRKGRNVTVGVEIDGQQQLNMHTLKKMMIEKNVFFTFAKQIGSPFGKEGISRRQATGAKHEQFMRVFPLFQQHKIHFPEELKDSPDMKEVMNELNYITYTGIGSKHDDALDCISMLASMEMIAPSMDLVMDNEITSASESIWGDFDNSSKVSTSGSTVF